MEKPNPVAITLIVGVVYFLLLILLGPLFFSSSETIMIIFLMATSLPSVCLLTFIISCLVQKEWSRENKYAVIIFFILFLIPCIIGLCLFFR